MPAIQAPKNPIFSIPRRRILMFWYMLLIHANRLHYAVSWRRSAYIPRGNSPTWHGLSHRGLDFSSQFRVNRFPVPWRYVRARTRVYAAGLDTRTSAAPPPSTFPTHPFISRWFFYSGSSLANLLESNACRNCGSRSNSAFFLQWKGREEQKAMINRKGSVFFVRNDACMCILNFSHFMIDLTLEFQKCIIIN